MKAYILVSLVPGLEANTIPQMVINQIRGLQGVQTTETLIGGVI